MAWPQTIARRPVPGVDARPQTDLPVLLPFEVKGPEEGLFRRRDGRLFLDEMISSRIPLADVNNAFEEMKKGAVARQVIVFD